MVETMSYATGSRQSKKKVGFIKINKGNKTIFRH